MYSDFASEVDRNTYEHDTLEFGLQLARKRWIAGYLVLNVRFYRVIPCHGYSQRGSDFIRRLGKILNGVALVILFILYGVCIVTFVSIPDHLIRCHSIDITLRVIFVLQTVQHYPEMIAGCIARQSCQLGVFRIFLAGVITLYMYIIVNGNKIEPNRA
ncbi:hypothetical protein EDD85DRAFT_473335 [Armillaria nabsnona]|nr:hypothetical protein EDD85DRAFT_473335 [Armillaria nabsnona]